MSNLLIRTRFAPAPTGLMHLGNVRTALMNYLFARKNNGACILRVEDTDLQRNFDPGARQILADLAWLHITYNEGPEQGGPYEPYFQSQRTLIYQEKLQELIEKNKVYRCFCSAEDLERKRERQIALKMPPRYDRTCFKLSDDTVKQRLAAGDDFIWRLKLPETESVEINDLARGSVHFEFQNFSDHPLTRQDGSITFIFANFVDDLLMNITHVFRGEDHLTNTAIQAVLYKAFNAPLPMYWHMPILCNIEGKKLSKRDFGFSLNDLRQAGYLPEAICNYLALIGGKSVEKEIMNLDELVQATDFEHISTAGQIKYDVEKLSWTNHKWIELLDKDELTQRCLPFLTPAFPQTATMDESELTTLIQTIKSDLSTLADAPQALHFYFTRPTITAQDLALALPSGSSGKIASLVKPHLATLHDPQQFMNALKADAKAAGLPLKELFAWLRFALMSKTEGPSINDLIKMLGTQEAEQRIIQCCASSNV